MVRYDIVIFGATGFTGKYVVDYVARRAQEEGFTWAVAGRSRGKLEEGLAETAERTGISVGSTPVLIANAGDAKSMDAMAQSAKVIINCVGPYRFYGDAVVSAAVRAGASHVDITGEPAYMTDMQIKYHDAAAAAGCYVVSGCGFDSIPAEYGVLELIDKFPGDLNDVHMFVQMLAHEGGGGYFGFTSGGHFTTFQSAIHGFANVAELKDMCATLMPKKFPKTVYPMKQPMYMWNEGIKKWAVVFPSSDRSVVRRSQYYRHFTEGQRPVQFLAYLEMPSLISIFVLTLYAIFFGIMAKFSWGRHLLETYPGFFSGGKFTHEGPTRYQLENSTFRMTLEGHGWKEKLADVNQQHTSPPDHTMVCEVRGPEPGYVATSAMVAESALILLRESDKCPSTGGVFTPATCFKDTSLRQKLAKTGVTITIKK